MKKVVVIGSGFGGLGAACLLAKSGYQVEVLEKNESLGGRASIFREDGFLFDMGPSWYLMPDIFEHFFELMGERVEDHLQLIKLNPSYRIFFKDEQQQVDLFSDVDRDARMFDSFEAGAGDKLRDYLRLSRKHYAIAKEYFLYRNYDSFLNLLTVDAMKNGSAIPLFRSLHKHVERYFSNEFLKKIMEYHLVFLGSSPYQAPALYNIMSSIDFDMGVFYPQGGIYEIIKALIRMGEKHGVAYRTNAPVAHIETNHGEAKTVVLASGERIVADIVISNADMHHTETALLSEEARTYPDKYWRKRELAPSALIMYLGVDGVIPSLTHHNLLFSRDWRKNFSEIFDEKVLPTDPSFYVSAPGKTDPSVAPNGKENLFVLVPTPPGLFAEPEKMTLYADAILETIEKEMHVPDLRKRIVYKKLFSDRDFAARYNSLGGTALGLSHSLWQTAFLRPSNVSKKVKNLFYVGANTNPGIGMPTCLVSAELVYKRVQGIKSPHPLKELLKNNKE